MDYQITLTVKQNKKLVKALKKAGAAHHYTTSMLWHKATTRIFGVDMYSFRITIDDVLYLQRIGLSMPKLRLAKKMEDGKFKLVYPKDW